MMTLLLAKVMIRSATGQGSDVVDGGSGNDIIYLEADGIWSRGLLQHVLPPGRHFVPC